MLWPPEVEARIRREARNLDAQKIPETVKFCTRCVLSNQRPRIVFDEEGVCSACHHAEKKKARIDWSSRRRQLENLLVAHRWQNGYNVVVPCSGGKDSSVVAHRLKHDYRMRPLCVKWAPLLYTDIGRRNLEGFIQSGFDVLECNPGGLLQRKLARLGLEFYGDPFLPFIYGQLAWPMTAAIRFDLPLVFFGENGEAEYGGDPSANDKPCWDYADWERIYLKGGDFDKLLSLGLELGAISRTEAESASMFYTLPPLELLKRRGIQFHWLGYYLPWHPQANYYYAAEHTGFEANEERSQGTYSKYASLDDKLDGLHYYLGYIKFGIGRCTSDAAHEVRDGDITRDEAIALVKRYDGEFPSRHLDDCLDYLGMDLDYLETVFDRFRPDHLWNGRSLRHSIGLQTDRAA